MLHDPKLDSTTEKLPTPARRPPDKTRNDPKMKAFLSACNALFDDNDEDANDDEGSAGDDNDGTDIDEDVYNFLAKVGCLKD